MTWVISAIAKIFTSGCCSLCRWWWWLVVPGVAPASAGAPPLSTPNPHSSSSFFNLGTGFFHPHAVYIASLKNMTNFLTQHKAFIKCMFWWWFSGHLLIFLHIPPFMFKLFSYFRNSLFRIFKFLPFFPVFLFQKIKLFLNHKASVFISIIAWKRIERLLFHVVK